ncbi:MAG: RNA 2',3'-cyclic phosphodiesterase [Verrucomicrobiota bacterium]
MNTPLEPTPDDHPIRTFVAVAINEAVREKLTEIQNRLRQTGADVGWVAPANIHLTLLFLGTVFESQVSTLATAMDAITSAYQPGKLEVKGIGSFGRPQSPRVIWAGLTGNLQPLLALQTEILAIAKKTGIYTDAKPFHPHLTIGRVRSTKNIEALLNALATWPDTVFGTITIDRVLLMKSELKAQGPVYTPLHTSRLTAV